MIIVTLMVLGFGEIDAGSGVANHGANHALGAML